MDSDRDLTLTEEEEKESLLWEYLEEGDYDYQQPQRGDIRDGVIMRKDSHQIIVDIGAKREGIVPETDLEKLGPEAVAELEVGDEVPVYVLRPETQEGDTLVSINVARQMADWERVEELMDAAEVLEEKITGYNKGGLLVNIGNLQGFIPRSHIVDLDRRTESGTPQERLRQMVDREIPLKIIEVNRRQRRLILSERAAWREWRSEQKKRLLNSLEVGDIRNGTVTSLADFGAFVDLGGADGLIHISELSWDRGKKPSDVVRPGDEVEVKIISLDRERKRIGLSLKQLKPNPWETLEERYAIGQYVDVEVTNLAKFGAFARLEEGIEGLIHISELEEHNVQHPSEVVAPGQPLTIQIISLDPDRKRVGLSLRRVPDHLRMPAETEEEVEVEEVREEQAEPVRAESERADLDEADTEEVETGDGEEVERPVTAEASAEEPAEHEAALAVGSPATDTQAEDSIFEEAGEPDEEVQETYPKASANGDNLAEEESDLVPAGEASGEA